MDIARLQKNWSNLGRADPLWAILGEASGKDGRWSQDAFFETGRGFIGWLARHLQGLGIQPRGKRALDFGCGYGRLTQPLSEFFTQTIGVDIADSMLEGARGCNRRGEAVQYVQNTAADLRRFGDAEFDFVLTLLVLQHMRSDYAHGYLREFLRILQPGGVLFFQLPVQLLARAAARSPGKVTPPTAMPAELCYAIDVQPGYLSLRPGDWRTFVVRLRNLGRSVLQIGAGNGEQQLIGRWLSEDGNVMAGSVFAAHPATIDPGDRADCLLQVRAPLHGGRFMLQVGIATAGVLIEIPDRPTPRVMANVPANAAAAEERREPPPLIEPPHAAADEQGDERIIEIYGTPTEQVCELLRRAGGRVIDVASDDWAGPDWLSAHYTVIKQ